MIGAKREVGEKWNLYRIVTKSGLTEEMAMRDWLQEGEYDGMKVIKLKELTEEERDEYLEVENKIFSLWADRLPKEE